MEVRVSTGLLQGQRLWVQKTKSSWRRSSLTPPQSCQNLHKTGKQTLGGHKENLMCTRTQKKGAVTPQETDPDLPGSVQESPADVWVGGGLLQVGGTECSSACMGSCEGGRHYTQPCPSTENWIKEQGPAQQNKTQFPLSQSLPAGNLYKLLILIH